MLFHESADFFLVAGSDNGEDGVVGVMGEELGEAFGHEFVAFVHENAVNVGVAVFDVFDEFGDGFL